MEITTIETKTFEQMQQAFEEFVNQIKTFASAGKTKNGFPTLMFAPC